MVVAQGQWFSYANLVLLSLVLWGAKMPLFCVFALSSSMLMTLVLIECELSGNLRCLCLVSIFVPFLTIFGYQILDYYSLFAAHYPI